MLDTHSFFFIIVVAAERGATIGTKRRIFEIPACFTVNFITVVKCVFKLSQCSFALFPAVKQVDGSANFEKSVCYIHEFLVFAVCSYHRFGDNGGIDRNETMTFETMLSCLKPFYIIGCAGNRTGYVNNIASVFQYLSLPIE